MTIQEIVKYILGHDIHKHNFDKSLFTRADCSEEELVEACEDVFYYDLLHWCGCGSPEVAKRGVRDYLFAISESSLKSTRMQKLFGVKYVNDSPLLICLAYTLDAAGLTEHGGSIGGAWLTKDGEVFLACLQLDKKLG